MNNFIPSWPHWWKSIRNTEKDVHWVQLKLSTKECDASTLHKALLSLHNVSPKTIISAVRVFMFTFIPVLLGSDLTKLPSIAKLHSLSFAKHLTFTFRLIRALIAGESAKEIQDYSWISA